MLKAIIFDMDGVIIDSEPIHKQADLLMMKELDILIDDDYHDNFIGSTDERMMEILKNDFNLSQSVDDLVKRKRQLLLDWTTKHPYPAVPHAISLINKLFKEPILLAIASSALKSRIIASTDQFGITNCFQQIVSGREVPNPKPFPDIFLLAANRLNLLPEECLVIEDSQVGTKAAKAANITCIGYKNPNSGNQDLTAANHVISSFEHITLQSFEDIYHSVQR